MQVNACKANVSDLVEFAEESHHNFANGTAFDLGGEELVDFAFDLGEEGRNLGIGNRAFPAGPFKTAAQFVPIKRDTGSISFSNMH